MSIIADAPQANRDVFVCLSECFKCLNIIDAVVTLILTSSDLYLYSTKLACKHQSLDDDPRQWALFAKECEEHKQYAAAVKV